MPRTTPESQTILGFKHFFGQKAPENRLNLIRTLCKSTIIGEIAGLNYRIKPKDTIYQDYSLKTQQEQLLFMCGSNHHLFAKYFRPLAPNWSDPKSKHYPVIFSRQQCLFAAEEIIQSDLKNVEGFTMKNHWEELLLYLLAVNDAITNLGGAEEEDQQTPTIESLNTKMVALNEAFVETNPLYTSFRGHKLLSYFSNHAMFRPHVVSYFQTTYAIEPEQFIYLLLSYYIGNNKGGVNNITNPLTGQQLDTSFIYGINERTKPFFRQLSQIFRSTKPERLISIKKYPFHQYSEELFCLIDNVLLIDKGYNQLINDFWFDSVKKLKDEHGNASFSIDRYRSEIGLFLEDYMTGILARCFAGSKYIVCKSFQELIVKVGKQQIELADIYIRSTKKILLAQVKATGLYDEEKFSGDLDAFYKYDRNKFFNAFGVNQLVDSIINLPLFATQIDAGYSSGNPYRIFPVIIVNEKALQTPFMAQVFNLRFQELLKEVKTNKATIHPLTLMHVSDWENMEDSLEKNPQSIWQLLQYNYRNPEFIPPFYTTLNRLNIKPDYTRPRELFEYLLQKYKGLEAPEINQKFK